MSKDIPSQRMFEVSEAAKECHLDRTQIQKWIEEEWICPAHPHDVQSLDGEDVARIRLIDELQLHLGVNDEAVPIILHLIDQLHCIRQKMAEEFKKETSRSE